MNKVSLLKLLEIALLLLMLLSLPSLEAPKNIFLVSFVVVAFYRQLISKDLRGWISWDWVFTSIIASALMTSIFAGMHTGAEWKGFRVLLTYILVGWLISRSKYNPKETGLIFATIIIATIPPLVDGLLRYLYFQNKPDLQLHSVGHVNHSAIYLTMIFGAMLSASLSLWSDAKPWLKWMLIILPIMFFLSLIVGQSRAAVGVGFATATILIFLLSKTKGIKWSAMMLLILITITTIFMDVGVVQKGRDTYKRNDVLASRDKVWNISLEAMRFSPLLGIGLINWGEIKPEDIKRSVEARGETYLESNYMFAGHSHSLYLTTIVERGIIGSFVMLIFMIAWMIHLIKNFKFTRNNIEASCLWGASLSAWLVSFGIGTVNTTMHHEHGILAFLFLALFLNYTKRLRQ